MQMLLHQTHHTIGDFEKIFQDLKQDLQAPHTKETLHIYPELYLTGYPLQDLVIQRTFIETYLKHFQEMSQFCLAQQPTEKENTALVGGLHYIFDDCGFPATIKNVIYEFRSGTAPRRIYTKALLPNYDIFDEKKYFSPRYEPVIHPFAGYQLGLMICEDMWFTGLHEYDPTIALYEKCLQENIQLDLIINLSASPYFLGKHSFRRERVKEVSTLFQAPFVYINRVGGEDEIQFDGSSFLHNGEEVIYQCRQFEKDLASLPLPSFQGNPSQPKLADIPNTWESLFKPSLDLTTSPPTLLPLTEKDCELIIKTLKLGLTDYARKCGFQNFLMALSGGLDSALVLTLLKIIIGDSHRLEALYMPGHYSAHLSWELSQEICQNLNIKLVNQPIKFFHNTIKHAFQDNFKQSLEGLADENIQSRLRGLLSYTRSNQNNSMVINTSNKSELAVGYSTLYGDSVGALSLLGDLYKSEIYQLAEFINQTYQAPIPKGIITRLPSAELRENQTDQQNLPPYERLDPILEGLLSYRYSPNDLIDHGFASSEVQKVYDLYTKSEYKRSQFCPIIKLKAKSFGFGYRMPITRQI